jgi:hypothetical protein
LLPSACVTLHFFSAPHWGSEFRTSIFQFGFVAPPRFRIPCFDFLCCILPQTVRINIRVFAKPNKTENGEKHQYWMNNNDKKINVRTLSEFHTKNHPEQKFESDGEDRRKNISILDEK